MRSWLTVLAALVSAGGSGLLHGEAPAPAPAPWQRILQGADAKKADELEQRLAAAQKAEKWEQALAAAQAVLELRQKVQGKDHWQAVHARWQVEAVRAVQRQGREGQKDYAGLAALDQEAQTLEGRGRYREALPLHQKALKVRLEVLGDEHPETANSYNNVAGNLQAQGKYAAAAESYGKALAIYRKVLGEEHPATAFTYNNVGLNLQAQGKYAAAEELVRKALAIARSVLGEDHLLTAICYTSVAANLNGQGKYAAAEEVYRKALDINRKVLGEENPNTISSYNELAINLNAQGKYAAADEGFRKALAFRRRVLGEEHPDTGESYNNLGANLHDQGQYAAAEENYRKGLVIRRKVLGEDHPVTAETYSNLALVLAAMGQLGAAEEGLRKALAIDRKVFGEEHPTTALSYNNLALNLRDQGQYTAADEVFRKALAIRRKVLGEEHPSTASSYNSLATNLDFQGQYAAALEGYRRALDIRRKLLGEEHPDTAISYNNLALGLREQGQYAAAEEGLRKALEIRRKVLGEEHRDTAISYNNLAANFHDQGNYAAAAEGYRRALAISRKVLGDDHLDTATCYDNLANNLSAQGQYAAAVPNYQKSLAIYRQRLGEEHPETATSYENMARNLAAQGEFAAAEDGFRKALAARRQTLGDEHPYTARSLSRLAADLHAQGQYAAAERLWLRAAATFAAARTRLAHSGLGRSTITSERSPLPSLAAVLARNGKPAAAWQRFEESLARGTWDDLSARLRRPAAEQAAQAALVARLERLDQLIEKATAVKDETPQQKKQREDLLGQRRKTQEELDAFVAHLEKTYGPAAGQVFDFPLIQAALLDDAALVGWIDLPPLSPKAADANGEHWAFLLRSRGEPVCVRLPGSGAGGAWTDEDTSLPERLRTALQTPQGAWRTLTRRLSEQRLLPLGKYLEASEGLPAVRRLVVLPSAALRGVPVEVLATDATVSYTPSGTLFAHLRNEPAVRSAGLLAVADPVFETPAAAKEHPLPPRGVLLTLVQPGSSAAAAGLRPDDVLLQYGQTPLNAPTDLAPAQASATGEPIPLSVWRNGKVLQLRIRPGKLGVVTADKPAPEALAQRYRSDRRLATRSGNDGWTPLPGTRVEVESLRRLFGPKTELKLLFDSDASEQNLDALASSELGHYRYLHLATHGEIDDTVALRSAILLSRDSLPDPQRQLLAGKPVYDGRLTAEEMLRSWHLDADLVTLSACQTALGKYETGEGFMGFAQALILCGSRSVCLSLWKVDDAATALLMQRFYANLLGKRDGLKAPLGKAEALSEAKHWLRTLTREEALKHAAAAYQGIERGKGRPKLPRLPPLPEPVPAAKEDCPYAHPYYWAAFVITGEAG
jgi:tetratricopeptide (TPR) repeat protein